MIIDDGPDQHISMKVYLTPGALIYSAASGHFHGLYSAHI